MSAPASSNAAPVWWTADGRLHDAPLPPGLPVVAGWDATGTLEVRTWSATEATYQLSTDFGVAWAVILAAPDEAGVSDPARQRWVRDYLESVRWDAIQGGAWRTASADDVMTPAPDLDGIVVGDHLEALGIQGCVYDHGTRSWRRSPEIEARWMAAMCAAAGVAPMAIEGRRLQSVDDLALFATALTGEEGAEAVPGPAEEGPPPEVPDAPPLMDLPPEASWGEMEHAGPAEEGPVSEGPPPADGGVADPEPPAWEDGPGEWDEAPPAWDGPPADDGFPPDGGSSRGGRKRGAGGRSPMRGRGEHLQEDFESFAERPTREDRDAAQLHLFGISTGGPEVAFRTIDGGDQGIDWSNWASNGDGGRRWVLRHVFFAFLLDESVFPEDLGIRIGFHLKGFAPLTPAQLHAAAQAVPDAVRRGVTVMSARTGARVWVLRVDRPGEASDVLALAEDGTLLRQERLLTILRRGIAAEGAPDLTGQRRKPPAFRHGI